MPEIHIGTRFNVEVWETREFDDPSRYIDRSSEWVLVKDKLGKVLCEFPDECLCYFESVREPSWFELLEMGKSDKVANRLLDMAQQKLLARYLDYLEESYCDQGDYIDEY